MDPAGLIDSSLCRHLFFGVAHKIRKDDGGKTMNFDSELERVRQKKMEELERKFLRKDEEKTINVPIQVTDATFDRVIKEHRVVVIDFWSEWCPPCHMISPIIEALARDYAGKAVFGKLNVDESPTIARKYSVMSIPTLLFFENGKLVDHIIGAVLREHIEQKLRKINSLMAWRPKAKYRA